MTSAYDLEGRDIKLAEDGLCMGCLTRGGPDMRAPISTEEEACMPQAILARAIGLLRPLSFDEMQDVIDAALATDDDFESSGEPPTYTYIGDRWQVEFRLGRPHLIDAVNVPPDAPRSPCGGGDEVSARRRCPGDGPAKAPHRVRGG